MEVRGKKVKDVNFKPHFNLKGISSQGCFKGILSMSLQSVTRYTDLKAVIIMNNKNFIFKRVWL
jgi:hypothetical protein